MTEGKHTIVYVASERVLSNPNQPGDRTAGMAQNSLKKSIREIGLQYPPLATRDPIGDTYTLVDGHRRTEAMKALAWESIPLLVATGSADELFSHVSGTTQKMKAIQWAYVYSRGAQIPSGQTKTCLNNLKNMCGMDFIKALIDAGISPHIWNLATRARKYMNLPGDEQRAVLEWLFHNKVTSAVNAWIAGENSTNELAKAFRENRKPMHLKKAA